MQPQKKGFDVSLALTIGAYLTLNSSLNLVNSWALRILGFRFPLLLTCTHMAFSFVALSPLMMAEQYRALHAQTIKRQWKGLVGIGAFMAVNIAFNNLSLVEITLSLNQIIRSSIPLITALLSVVIERKIPSHAEVASLVTLCLGVMIAVWQGTVAGGAKGITLCFLGTVSNSAMMTTSGKLLSEKLDVLRLAFYTAPVSFLCLTPVFLIRESARFAAYIPDHSTSTVAFLLVSSMNAIAYNIIHFMTIQRTSAVTTTVLGEVKIVGLLILSAVLLGESSIFNAKMSLGCLLAIGGFVMYSHCKIIQARQALLKIQNLEAKPLLAEQTPASTASTNDGK